MDEYKEVPNDFPDGFEETPLWKRVKGRRPLYFAFNPKNEAAVIYNIRYSTLNGKKIKYASVVYEDSETSELTERTLPFLDLFTKRGFTTDDPSLKEVIDKETRKQQLLDGFDLFEKPVEEITAMDFHRLVNYALLSEMCLKRWCTTCGCMEFRELCKSLGKEKMTAIVEAVPEEYIKNGLTYPEYTALELIRITTGISADNPLMRLYTRTEEKRREEYLARQKAAAEKKQKEMQLAEERREKKKKEKADWREQHNKERENIRARLKTMPIEEQLALLCDENAFMPGYYDIEYSKISDEELQNLPLELLERLAVTFPTVKDKQWKEFRKRIRTILKSKNTTE
jgi:hypothetical protein